MLVHEQFTYKKRIWVVFYEVGFDDHVYVVATRRTKLVGQPIGALVPTEVFRKVPAEPFSFGLIGDMPRNVDPTFILVKDDDAITAVRAEVTRVFGGEFVAKPGKVAEK